MEKIAYYTNKAGDFAHVYDNSVIEIFRLCGRGVYILEETIAVTKEEVPATLKEFGF